MHDVAAAFHYFPCKTVISAHEQKKMNMILGSPRRLAPAFYVYKMGVWTPHSYWNGDDIYTMIHSRHGTHGQPLENHTPTHPGRFGPFGVEVVKRTDGPTLAPCDALQEGPGSRRLLAVRRLGGDAPVRPDEAKTPAAPVPRSATRGGGQGRCYILLGSEA